MTDSTTATIAIRAATPADDGALQLLSNLDSARLVERPALVAAVDDVPVAALSLADDRVVADPFQPTSDVVALLRARAAALRGTSRASHRRRLPAWRLRHAA